MRKGISYDETEFKEQIKQIYKTLDSITEEIAYYLLKNQDENSSMPGIFNDRINYIIEKLNNFQIEDFKKINLFEKRNDLEKKLSQETIKFP